MKFLLFLILLIALGIGSFFIYQKYFSPPKIEQTSNTAVSCVEGVEGNAGDNYCSNTYGGGSKCSPGFEGNYPDGCTKQ